MKLAKWFKYHKKRNQGYISVEQSILAGQYKKYGFFRLKFFNVQLLLHFIVHLILISTFIMHFSSKQSSYLILLIALSQTLNVAWWGGLELMRTSIRNLSRENKKYQIAERIGLWLFLGFCCSGIFSVWALAIFFKHLTVLSKYDLSLISILLSMAMQFPVRVYHSGIYALRRVARATWSLFISDIAFVLLMLVIYPIFGLYNIAISILFKNIIGQMILVYYVRRSYRLFSLSVVWPSSTRVKQFIYSFPVLAFVKTSLSMASFSAEHIVVALWFVSTQYTAYQNDNVTFFVLILPLLYASVDWARIFYFDYKKIINHDFSHFYKRFEHNVMKIAVLSGLFYWALACATHFIVMPHHSFTLCLWLMPVFILRSKIAIALIKQFSEMNYGLVLFSNAVLVGGLVCIYLLDVDWMVKAGLLIGICWGLITYLARCNTRIKPESTPASTQHFYAWLHHLRNAVAIKSMQVHIFHYSTNLKSHVIDNLVKQLYEYFNQSSHEICIYKNQILVFSDKPLALEKLVLLTGGRIYYHSLLEVDSVDYILRYLLPKLDGFEASLLGHYRSVDEIKAQFFNLFPKGICFSPEYHLGPEATPLSNRTMQGIIYSVKKYLMNPQTPYVNGYFLSVLYYSQKIKIIFLIPKDKNAGETLCSPRFWQKNIDFICKLKSLDRVLV